MPVQDLIAVIVPRSRLLLEPPPEQDILLRLTGAAKPLGVSVGSFNRIRKMDPTFPTEVHVIGSTVAFWQSELATYAEKFRQRPRMPKGDPCPRVALLHKSREGFIS